MEKEIERKFLIDAEKLPPLSNGKHIVQGYLSEYPQIRVRLITDGANIESATMAYKSPARLASQLARPPFGLSHQAIAGRAGVAGGAPVVLVREEIEFSIPLKEAKELMAQTDIQLEKTRFLIGRWEIDVYGGKNLGLVVAEIELKSEDEDVGILPAWISKEVTGDKRYGNVTLAKKGFRL